MAFRFEPSMGPQNYKTYAMSAPLRTHWRPATCEEYECEQYLNGFATTVDITTNLGQKQYHYLTHDRSRAYRLVRVSLELVRFEYGPGNFCFSMAEHRVPIGKPPRLLVVGGDWRGNPDHRRRVHTRVEDWVEDSALHLNHLAEIHRRG
jgi:hypothetical protein